MKKIYCQVFKGNTPPEWISIKAAFSYALALIEDRYNSDDNKTTKGHIDITSPLEAYDVPDAEELANIENEIENENGTTKECIFDVDAALFERLTDGSIECQGRKRETRRVATNPHNPPHEYFKGEDERRLIGSYRTICRSFWEEELPYINYKDESVIKWEKDPKDINEYGHCDENDDAHFQISGISIGEHYVWKEEWASLQIRTADLLKVTEKLFDGYCRQNFTEGPIEDFRSETMNVHDKNRFFYSKSDARWIVEFKGEVFCIDTPESSIRVKTVQYLLRNGNSDIEKALRMCSWDILDQGGVHIHRSMSEGDKVLDNKALELIQKEVDRLNTQHDHADDEAERKAIEKKINSIRNETEKHLNIRGKSKRIDDDIEKMKRRVKKRIADFKLDILTDHAEFKNHLDAAIKSDVTGIAYNSDEQWSTDGR